MGQIIVVMGVSGCGKTTVGELVAEGLACEFIEGDEYHSRENIAKMASGQPLNDEDRRNWMVSLNRKLGEVLATGRQAVLACSALKEAYRQWLAKDLQEQILFIFLKGDFDEINRRMEDRIDHYMKADMLASQFEALEEPQGVPTFDLVLGSDTIARRVLALPEVVGVWRETGRPSSS